MSSVKEKVSCVDMSQYCSKQRDEVNVRKKFLFSLDNVLRSDR